MRKTLIWFAAFVITIGAAFYQRMTGPTYPERIKLTLNGNEYKLNLKRSQTNTRPCFIRLEVPEGVKGRIFYKRYGLDEEWSSSEMTREEGILKGELPTQPSAGKLYYYITLLTAEGLEITIPENNPVVIRFKGNVPAVIMLPHIIIMFLAMLLSTVAGFMAAAGLPLHRRYGIWAMWLLVAGGMILGPLVQLYAFGELWTGVPFGWDLTDNKTLIAVTAWIVAVVLNRKKDRPVYTIIAAVLLLLIFSVPHSLFGSELNYSTGTITQG